MKITTKTAKEAWKKVLKHVYENGNNFKDKDGRTCRELLNIGVTITDTKAITKPIEILNSFKKWVYPALEEIKAVNLDKKGVTGYYYNYGVRAFNFNKTTNQIDDYIIPLLKKNKASKRATIVLYNPETDSSLHKKDIPSVIMMQFNLRKGKLHATTVIRSCDLFFGLPANLYQSYILQKYIARQLECELGSITIHSVSAHVFDDQFEYIEKVI